MIQYIEHFLRSLNADQITDLFFWVLLAIFFIGLLMFLFSRRSSQSRAAQFADYAPILLTSIGILGTFTGIVAGLLNFDIENIDHSISTLLGGMKTAFLTSVIGVALSISLKVVHTLIGKTQSKVNKGLNVESLVESFYLQGEELKQQTTHLKQLIDSDRQQQTQTQQHQAELLNQISTMVKTLGSETESSLLGQIKLLRTDVNDAQKAVQKQSEQAVVLLEKITNTHTNNQQTFAEFEQKLWKTLQDFSEMMSKSATEAVIEALKQVIVEFNHNLTEQFGDNFKALNQAVHDLVQWQDNYKNQLNEMIGLYNAGVQSLSVTEQSVSLIEQKTQTIPTTMAQLSEMLEVNQHQIQQLNQHLDSFAQLRDKAVEAIPQTQQQVSTMLENVTQATSSLSNALKQGGEQLQQALEKSGKQLEADMSTSAQTFGQTLTGLADSTAQEIGRAGEAFAQQTQQSQRVLIDIGTTLGSTSENLNRQQSELMSQQQRLTSELLQFIENWQQSFEKHSKTLQSNFVATVEEMARKQSTENERLMRHLEDESKKALAVTGENVNKQLEYIDETMQKEVTRVMQEMGNALATISRQFTNDYSKLVEAMGKIVRSQI